MSTDQPYAWLKISSAPKADERRPMPARSDPLTSEADWAQAALGNESHAVAIAPYGTRNHRLNQAAFSLGQIEGKGLLQHEVIVAALCQACEENGLWAEDHAQCLRTIDSGISAGVKEPRGPAERPEQPTEALEPTKPPWGMATPRSALSGLPKASPLIEGVLSTPCAAVLVGGYSLGKSVLVHGLASAVALGVPWLGRPTRSARVMVVVGEGAWGLHDRFAAWEQAWNQGRPIPDDRIEFLIKPASLSSPLTWTALTERAMETGAGLVILDTFSSLAPDADETKDAAQIMRRLSDMSSAINGTVLLVHHPGWGDGTRTRGGYQFEANADEVLVMTEVAENAGLIQVMRKKVKDGPSGAVFYVRRVPSGPSVIFQHATVEEADGLPAAIHACLMDLGEKGATGPQLRAMLGIGEGAEYRAFYRALNALKDAGKVVSEGSRRTEVHRAIVT